MRVVVAEVIEIGAKDCTLDWQGSRISVRVPSLPRTSQAVVFWVLPGWTVHVPDWVAATVPVMVVEVRVTGTAVWFDAITTGELFAMVAWPLAFALVTETEAAP